ncbi:hypothetical protein TNIN_190111 [Trichonephila inaurata madagascariensis]|uniref:Uncharacterized protein n=1 Tax=Trichonephila inaurata madagascariensis TaxID=2747483 RepID=A0A8X6KBZ8_9ARAC|nr:hypothetical protein TNIN_190111 [Trichonephila inaurata madagascariensis]
MDIWRNERLVFETLPSGDVKCSVDKGTEGRQIWIDPNCKKAERRIQTKKRKNILLPKFHKRTKSRGPSETVVWQDNSTSRLAVRGSIVFPVNCLRRSSRFQVLPMDIWRNERLMFETLPSGDVKCSVDKGTEEDKFGYIQIAKKAERRIQTKKEKTLLAVICP